MSPHYWIGPISKGGDSYPTYLPTYLLLFFALPCTYYLNIFVYRAVRVDGSTEREREKVQLTTLNQTTTLVVYNTQSGEHAKPKPWRKLT